MPGSVYCPKRGPSLRYSRGIDALAEVVRPQRPTDGARLPPQIDRSILGRVRRAYTDPTSIL